MRGGVRLFVCRRFVRVACPAVSPRAFEEWGCDGNWVIDG
jgi:hypothetical protein